MGGFIRASMNNRKNQRGFVLLSVLIHLGAATALLHAHLQCLIEAHRQLILFQQWTEHHGESTRR